MAERVPPPTDEARILESSPDVRPSATSYIVQVPKDQIYRIPPPENAAIAQSRRPEKSTRYNPPDKRPRLPMRTSCRCCCVFLVLLVLALFACHVIVAYLYQPQLPSFHVERVAGINSRGGGYAVRLRVENPNARMDFVYRRRASGAAAVSLLSEKGVVAAAKFPEFRHKHGSSAMVEIALRGGGREARPIVRLEIGHVAARTEVWTWSAGTVEFDVVCDVTVDSLKSRALSQDCRTRTTKPGIHRSV